MKHKITDCKHRKNDSPEVSELIAKILDGPDIATGLDVVREEEDYLAHLFYDAMNPTIEFTVMPAEVSQTMTIPFNDVYVGSWQIKGFNFPALTFLTCENYDSWIYKKDHWQSSAVARSAQDAAYNMDLLGFRRANVLQAPKPRT